jgi:site-specific recombinase
MTTTGMERRFDKPASSRSSNAALVVASPGAGEKSHGSRAVVTGSHGMTRDAVRYAYFLVAAGGGGGGGVSALKMSCWTFH